MFRVFVCAFSASFLRNSISQESPRQTKPKKGPKRKVHEFRPFLSDFWCISLGKQARFTLNFCSGMPLWKVHELTLRWFGLPGPLLNLLRALWFSGVRGTFRISGVRKFRVVSKRLVLASVSPVPTFPPNAVLAWQKTAMIFDIPGPQETERGHIRQNRPFTKPPLCFSRAFSTFSPFSGECLTPLVLSLW